MDLPYLGIIGGDSLVGQEIERLAGEELPGCSVESYGANPGSFELESDGEEASIVAPLDAGVISELDLAFLTGTPESGRHIVDLVSGMKPRPVLLDLSGTLDDRPEARLRSPLYFADPESNGASVQVIAHPAATAVAMLLDGCSRLASVRSSVVHVFEPVSERGPAGIRELQQQTVSLLSFKSVPKNVFDTQVSFNMLPRYGAKAAESLSDIEARIERHLATLLARKTAVPLPSLRLVHAPVFHNYTISAWVEFETRPALTELAEELDSQWMKMQPGDEEPLGNVSVSGTSGITVVALEADRNHPRAAWFWLAADNIHLAAESAVWTAKAVLYPAPEGGK